MDKYPLRTVLLPIFMIILFHQNVVSGFSQTPVLLISLDGLGWRYTGGKLANTTNLDYVAATGVKAEWMETIMPTKTWPTHQTYLTGLYPEDHGIVANKFWDPLYQEKFILQHDCSNFDPKFYNASEPIWLTVQKRGGKSGVHFWPGFYSYPQKPSYAEKPTCFVNCSAIDSKDLPKLRNKTRAGWPPYIHCFANQSLPYANRVDKIMGWLKSEDPPKFLAMYISEPDSSGHGFGITSGHYVKAVEKVDKEVLGYLFTSLKKDNLLDKVNIIIVSDHSMIETSSTRAIYLSDYINPSDFMMSESGAIGHLWPYDRVGLVDEIYTNLTLASQRNGHFKVYRKEDIKESLHWKHNRRIPPLYVEPEVGWTVYQNRPVTMTNWTSADHGWIPNKDLGAIFYARGPAFKRNYQSKERLRAIDVYPLLCHLLEMKPLSNNGSLENMKELLMEKSPGSGAKRNGLWVISCVLSLLVAFFSKI